MQDIEAQLADVDAVALVEPAVRREVPHAGDAEIGAALDHMIEHIFVRDMRADDVHLESVA